MFSRTHQEVPISQRVRTEPGQKRIRTYFGGEVVADSSDVLLVWDKPYYPTYYFPTSDVRMQYLAENGETVRSPSRGDGHSFNLSVNGSSAQGAARIHKESPVEDLRDRVAFRWQSMDAWFEEDEQVYVHARDPFTRLDVLASSRPVRVEVDGVPIAASTSSRFLFETGLPTRYYIPKTDIRMELLTATDLHTECPYKGVASYYSVDTGKAEHENIAWWYPFPVQESAQIAGMVAFYNEKVDLFVDGQALERPRTIFS